MARFVGDAASVPLLHRSLGEEQAMADFLETQLVPTTDRSLSLTGDGATAGT